jgi:hypothetical protein
MRKKQIQNWTREELIEELKRKNFQYGQLANKYAELKFKLENICESQNVNNAKSEVNE